MNVSDPTGYEQAQKRRHLHGPRSLPVQKEKRGYQDSSGQWKRVPRADGVPHLTSAQINRALNPEIDPHIEGMVRYFYDRVEYDPNGGCWLWSGALSTSGYGVVGRLKPEMTAHRFSYHVHVGGISEGMHVLHRCDVRACCNPDHLFLGTHADNMRDMREKGRNHIPRKLSLEQRQQIAERCLDRVSDVARDFDVHEATVALIWREKDVSRRDRKKEPRDIESAVTRIIAGTNALDKITVIDADRLQRLRQIVVRLSNSERRFTRESER